MSGPALFKTFARAPLEIRARRRLLASDRIGRACISTSPQASAVNSLGHCHPHLVAALTEQAGRLWHVSNLYEIPGQSRLGERLTDSTSPIASSSPNSGAEALECAIKTARRYHYAKGHSDRFPDHHLEGAFHGRTLATIAAGGQGEISRRFRPQGRRLRPGAF